MSARGQGLQGRKVLVKLKDGTKIVDIFKDNTSRHIILAEHGRVRRDEIKKMTPWIDPQYLWAKPKTAREFDSAQAKALPEICPMRDWVPGTFCLALGGPGERYITCCKVLNKEGECPEHGKVRFTGHEHLHEEKDDRPQPSLRWTPPRKIRGKTVARMLHTKRVMGWA
jgi:hypothetical protein